MASAGRILIIPKGTWDSSTTYNPLDMVYYGGNSYVCKNTITSAVDPASDTTNWQQMASGFDSDLITQTITNEPNHIASDAAVYAECQKLEGNFATIEASSTASKAYAVGDYLTLGGALYKVTTAIANGGTIVPGTNVQTTSAGGELTALNTSLKSLFVGQTVRIATVTANTNTEVDLTLSSYTLIGVRVGTANKITHFALGYNQHLYAAWSDDLSNVPVYAYYILTSMLGSV